MFVSKIIGARGCMIQEIAASSGGAIIKILADKRDEKSEEETVVAVMGTPSVVLDATKKIIEQVEYFKNGGPVLLNGKSIFGDIASQFRNSIVNINGEYFKIGGGQINKNDNTTFDFNLKFNPNNTHGNNFLDFGRDQGNRSRSNSRNRGRRGDDRGGRNNYRNDRDYDRTGYNKDSWKDGNDYRDKRWDNKDSYGGKDDRFDRNYRGDRRDFRGRDGRDDKYGYDSKYPKRSSRSRSYSQKNNSYKYDNNKGKFNQKNERGQQFDKVFDQDFKPNNYESFPPSSNSNNNQISNNNNTSSNGKDNNASNKDTKDFRDYNRDNNRQLYTKTDTSKNISYDEKGVKKIITTIVVPDNLVSLLIGKNGDSIKGIMSKTDSIVSFAKEVSFFKLKYQSDCKVQSEGVLGRICIIKGTLENNLKAVKLIYENVEKLESSINGVRYEK